MKIIQNAISWQTGLFLAAVLFVLTRALTLTSFPIFNDEAIYLQYSQLIHDDWNENRFISMNGEYGDWKPPLQYWLAAPVIRNGTDPLVTGRLVAMLVSFLGLFGVYLFTKQIFSEREGVLATIAYVFCPPVLFYNNQFVAETFLFSTTPFLYWSLLKAMQPGQLRFFWVITAILLGLALLLFKQSGVQLLGMALALPFARLSANDRTTAHSLNWKTLLRNFAIVAVVMLSAYLAAAWATPSEFNATRDRFNRQWIMSLHDILEFPWPTWRANLGLASEYIHSYYSWGVPLIFCIFVWFAWRKRNATELSLAAMCFGGAATIIFVVRGFNEYLLNTAVIVVLLPLLARTLVMIWDLAPHGKTRFVRISSFGLTGVILTFWIYQITLMWWSPGNYIERSTKWADANYLKGWPTGFGVKEIVEMLAKEKEPGVIITNTQLGNPATALEVYARSRFPRLRVVRISKDLLDAPHIERLKEGVNKIGPAHYVIESADTSGTRAQWLADVTRQLCATGMEVRGYPGQMPIIVCRF